MPTAKENLRDRLDQCRQIEISVFGRKSGRRISMPVWHVVHRNYLYLLPVRGSDTQWYRNLLRNPAIRISVRGQKAEFRSTRITGSKGVLSVIRRFGRKYRAQVVKKLYSKFDVAVRVKLT